MFVVYFLQGRPGTARVMSHDVKRIRWGCVVRAVKNVDEAERTVLHRTCRVALSAKTSL